MEGQSGTVGLEDQWGAGGLEDRDKGPSASKGPEVHGGARGVTDQGETVEQGSPPSGTREKTDYGGINRSASNG